MTVKRPRRPLAEVRTITVPPEDPRWKDAGNYEAGDIIALVHELKLYGPDRTVPAGTEVLVTSVRKYQNYCYHVRTVEGEELACTPSEVQPIGPASAAVGDEIEFTTSKRPSWVKGDYGTVIGEDRAWFTGVSGPATFSVPGLIIRHETGQNYIVRYSEVKKR